MPNNNDPFPVDLKIEEFETHYPPTYIYSLNACAMAKEAAAGAMAVGFNASKRLIKIENNLSTLMRYFFRLAARVPINCVYYGGQVAGSQAKYACIRCLCDDRITDGMLVQIDQCLTCTRYEPVFGQMYEVLNDIGANVAAILDTNQMSYSNMGEYINLARSEKFHREAERGEIDLATIKKRDSKEHEFNQLWPQGIKMDWHYIPAESQQVHINWRQDINNDGKKLARLDSFPCSPENSGATNVSGKNSLADLIKRNKESMDQHISDGGAVGMAIQSASNMTNMADDAHNFYAGQAMNDIKSEAQKVGMDALLIAMVSYNSGKETNISSIISKIQSIENELGTKNPAIVLTAYKTGTDVMKKAIEAAKTKDPKGDNNKDGK